MDETIAKREARRKRILENSERRLQKITDISTKYAALNVYSNELNLGIDGICVNKTLIHDENDALYLQDDNVTKNKDETNIESYSGSNNEDTCFVLSNSDKCNDITNDELDCTNTLKHLDYHNESTDYIQDGNSTNNQMQQNECNKSLSDYILSDSMSYVVLAAIVNILSLFKMDHLFWKSAFIPFFIMIFGRLCTHNIQELQKGNLFIATLALWNIKPASIYRFTRVMNILFFIAINFSIYIFTFVVIHCVITYY